MPTVIDSLIVTLGLDPSKFTAGQKKVVDGLRETEVNAERTDKTVQRGQKNTAESFHRTEVVASRAGKNIEHSGVNAAEFFTRMRNQALALFAVFTGGRGLKEFAVSTTNVAAATGRLAHNLSLSTTELSAWQIAASQFAGGSAAATAASLTNLSQALTSAALTGTSGLPQFFRILGVRLTDAHNKARSLNDILLDVAGSKKFQSMTPAQQVFFGHQIGLDDGTINLLQQGRAAVEAALAKARQQGTINKEQAETFQKLQTAAVGASTALDALGRLILEKLAPTIIAVLDAISKTKPIVDGVKKIFDPNNYQFHSDTPTPPAIRAIGDWWRSHAPVMLGGTPPANTNAESIGKARTAAAYFESQGWTKNQSAGIVANLMRESHFNAGEVGDGGQAYGVAQWHPDRQAAFARWAGHDIRQSTLQEQLAFVQYELTQGNEQAAGARLRATATRGDAARAVSTYYERPANTAGEADQRAALADSLAPHLAPTNDFSSVDTILNGIRASRGGDVTNNAGAHTETHIGQITVNTKATDAKGIAAGIGGALRSNPLVPQANTGLAY